MAVFTFYLVDPQFEHRSGECAYIADALLKCAAKLQSTQQIGSVPVFGINWLGQNVALGNYVYNPLASLP
jgi:hypothetical protein